MFLIFVINDVHSLMWAMISLLFLSEVLLMVVFLVHRKNNYRRFEQFEQRMHEFIETALRGGELKEKTEEPELSLFKDALWLHLNELTQRIAKSEEQTYKLSNQIEALTTLIASFDEDEGTTADEYESHKPGQEWAD